MPKEQKSSTRGTYNREPYPSSFGAPHLYVPGAQSNALPTNERSSTAWTREDDLQLMKARSESQNWGPIASKYFPTKTPNACRKRHERLMEKRQSENWDGVKLDSLAKAYIECREEMWQILAEKVGEKWAMVESKCMEKGLKTLQQAARSALRRDSRFRSNSPTDHRSDDDHFDDNGFDDSGLGPDVTPGNENSHTDFPPPTDRNSRASSGPAYTSPSGQHNAYSIASHSSTGLSSSNRVTGMHYDYTQAQLQPESQAPSPVDSRRTSHSLPSFRAFENITFSTSHSVSMPSVAYCS